MKRANASATPGEASAPAEAAPVSRSRRVDPASPAEREQVAAAALAEEQADAPEAAPAEGPADLAPPLVDPAALRTPLARLFECATYGAVLGLRRWFPDLTITADDARELAGYSAEEIALLIASPGLAKLTRFAGGLPAALAARFLAKRASEPAPTPPAAEEKPAARPASPMIREVVAG